MTTALYIEGAPRSSFFNPGTRIVEEIARLEQIVVACEVDISARCAERKKLIDDREKNLETFWGKLNNLNEYERKIQAVPRSKDEKNLLFRKLTSVRDLNRDAVEPEIKNTDTQIEKVEAILLELQKELDTSRTQLEQWRATLALLVSLSRGGDASSEEEAGTEEARIASGPHSASAA